MRRAGAAARRRLLDVRELHVFALRLIISVNPIPPRAQIHECVAAEKTHHCRAEYPNR
jgi:hypothetical protein